LTSSPLRTFSSSSSSSFLLLLLPPPPSSSSSFLLLFLPPPLLLLLLLEHLIYSSGDPTSQSSVFCRHPFEESKRALVKPTLVEPLLRLFWENGKVLVFSISVLLLPFLFLSLFLPLFCHFRLFSSYTLFLVIVGGGITEDRSSEGVLSVAIERPQIRLPPRPQPHPL